MSKSILLFILSISLFAQESDFVDLEKEINGLIDNYCERIYIATQENLQDRVKLLDKTLSCLINVKSKKDIIDCKTDERKRILDLIKE